MIRLKEITNKNVIDVIRLHVKANQKEYVADNEISLAKSICDAK
ncbi:MAG: hypothetical protein PUF50_06505 [Erysipelotrichaceae bacterium]|nr:hypothetical protein [Erysipelotrichaceae bacterium]